MDRHTITVFRVDEGPGRGFWATRHTDPNVIDLFGGDVIPTAFLDSMPAEEVIEYLKKTWPDYDIRVEE
jgi:hypothetical protein